MLFSQDGNQSKAASVVISPKTSGHFQIPLFVKHKIKKYKIISFGASANCN